MKGPGRSGSSRASRSRGDTGSRGGDTVRSATDDKLTRRLAAFVVVAFILGEVGAGAGVSKPVPPEMSPIVTLAAGYLFGRQFFKGLRDD